MGSGRWTTDVYEERARAKAKAGIPTFSYNASLGNLPRSAWRPHQTLDPFGVTMRESRDSDEHPTSLAIAVIMDVTGSMLEIPQILQRKLPGLHGLILRKSYVEHPQILFGAIGDATCDRVPLQIGQFESDNRMDEQLENLVLEGGGGGQKTESYELALYFFARHTAIDCFEKRGKKGYLFLIGDEMAYPAVKTTEVARLLGHELPQNIPVDQIVREARLRYQVFYLLPKSASYGGDREILNFWRKLLGQNVLELDDPAAVCETIALTIGLSEGIIDLDEGITHLSDLGADRATRQSVSLALRPIANRVTVKSSDVILPGLVTTFTQPPMTQRL